MGFGGDHISCDSCTRLRTDFTVEKWSGSEKSHVWFAIRIPLIPKSLKYWNILRHSREANMMLPYPEDIIYPICLVHWEAVILLSFVPIPLSRGHLGYPTFIPLVQRTLAISHIYLICPMNNPTLRIMAIILLLPSFSPKDTWDILHLSHLSWGYLGYLTFIPSLLRTLGICSIYSNCSTYWEAIFVLSFPSHCPEDTWGIPHLSHLSYALVYNKRTLTLFPSHYYMYTCI